MNHFRIVPFAFILLSALRASGQGGPEQQVNNFLRTHFPGSGVQVHGLTSSEENGAKVWSGSVDLMGVENIEIAATTVEGDKVKTLTAQFPANAKVSVDQLNPACGGKLRSYLPPHLATDAGIGIRRMELAAAGTDLQRVFLDLFVDAPWNVLDLGDLRLTDVGIELEVLRSGGEEAKVRVTAKGVATIGAGQVQFATSASSTDPADIRLEGQLDRVSAGDVYRSVMGPDKANAFLATAPPAFRDLALEQVRFVVYPRTKRFYGYASSGIGQVEVGVTAGSTINGALVVAPAGEFKFSSLGSELALLDPLRFTGTAVALTSAAGLYLGEVEQLRALGDANGVPLIAGLNLFASLSLDGQLRDLLKVNAVAMRGRASADLSYFLIEGGIDADIPLGEDVTFKEAVFGVQVGKGIADFRMKGTIEAMIGGDRLSFSGELAAGLLDQNLQGALYLQALQKAGGATAQATVENDLLSPPEWTEPFGVQGIAIRDLGGSVGIDPKLPPIFLNSLGVAGNIRIGTAPSQDRHLIGDFTTKLNISSVSRSLFDVQVKNMTIAGFYNAFSTTPLEGFLEDALSWGMDDGWFYLVPVQQEYLGKVYEEGVSAGGNTRIAGLTAIADMRVRGTDVGIAGTMDPVKVEAAGLVLFGIEGNEGGKPTFRLDVSEDPKVVIDGVMTVLGSSNRTTADITKEGFVLRLANKPLIGSIAADFEVTAKDLTPGGDFYLKAHLSTDLLGMVKKDVTRYITEAANSSKGAIDEAKRQLDRYKSANAFEKAMLTALSSALGGVNQVTDGVAVASAYVANSSLDQVLNIRSVHFEGGLRDMSSKVGALVDVTVAGSERSLHVDLDLDMSSPEQLAASIAGQIDDAILDMFGDLDNVIANAMKGLANELAAAMEAVGNGLGQLAGMVQDGVVELAEGVTSLFYDPAANAEMYRRLQGDPVPPPTNGADQQYLIPYTTKYFIQVDRVETTKAEAAPLALYGKINVSGTGAMYKNEGANQYLFHARRGGRVNIENGHQGRFQAGRKTFYIEDRLIDGSLSFQVDAYLYALPEFGNIDRDKAMTGKVSIPLSVIVPSDREIKEKTFEMMVSAADGSNAAKVVLKVIAPIKVSDERMVASAKSGMIEELEWNIKNGGNPFNPEIMSNAVQSKNPDMVDHLENYGNVVTPKDMGAMFHQSAFSMKMLDHLLAKGIRPLGPEMNGAVGMGEPDVVLKLIDNGCVVTDAQVMVALERKDLETTKALLSTHITCSAASVNKAAALRYWDVLDLMAKYNAKTDVANLVQAIYDKDDELAKALAKVTTPDNECLVTAASNGNTALFEHLVQHGGRVTDDVAMKVAINADNMRILELCLEHGGDATRAIQLAQPYKNKAAMVLGLKHQGNPDGALSLAAETNDVPFFTELLEQYGASPNYALDRAVYKGKNDLVPIALKAGADPSGYVRVASRSDNMAMIQTLLDAGGDPNEGMLTALEARKDQQVLLFIERGAQVADPKYMGLAARNQSVPVVKALLDAGATPDPGMRPAVTAKNIEITTLLLDQGAAPDTYIDIAARLDDIAMCRLLLARGARPDPGLEPAVRRENVNLVTLLLDHGAVPKGVLEYPAKKKNALLMDVLLKAGADPNEAIAICARDREVDLVRMLVEAGASVENPEFILFAADKGDLPLVKLLLQYGAPVDAWETKSEETVLHLAAGNKDDLDLVKLLVEAGADVNARDRKGNTVLHACVRKGNKNLEVCRYLVEHGADVNAVDEKGRSVLKDARGKEMKELIIQLGGVE